MSKSQNIVTTEAQAEKNRAKIHDLAAKGLAPAEVATAIGFSPAQFAEILNNDDHPFNVIYWNAKVEYGEQLRTAALDIILTCSDAGVKAKLLEFLMQENNKMLENKRLVIRKFWRCKRPARRSMSVAP